MSFPSNPNHCKSLDTALAFLQVIARETTNRHVGAAMVSALFNLVVKSQPPSDPDLLEPASVSTARELQQICSEHADVNFSTLAKALSAIKDILPSGLYQRMVSVNKAASYNRHQQVKDTSLIADVKTALQNHSCNKKEVSSLSASVIYLDNLVPTPCDTSDIVPPPAASDTTSLEAPPIAACKNVHEEFEEYYRSHFKTHAVVWEPIHSKFTTHWSGPLGPSFDLQAMKSSLDEFETNLYNIDGPQPTWHF